MPPSFPSRSSRSKFSFLSFRAESETSHVSGASSLSSTSFFQSSACSRILRLCVAEKQHVAQRHHGIAVVLRKLVGVELRERLRQPALHSRRQRLLHLLPVERHELAEFVRPLDHVLERFRHERPRTFAPRQFARHKERRMTKLHLVAGLARQSRHILRLALRAQAPRSASQCRSPSRKTYLPRASTSARSAAVPSSHLTLLRHRPFVRPHRKHPLPHIHFHHHHHSSLLRLCRSFL